MERTTSSGDKRSAGRSGGIRWFLDRVGEGRGRRDVEQVRVRVADTRLRDTFWGDVNEEGNTPATKRCVVWMEQQELWPGRGEAAQVPADAGLFTSAPARAGSVEDTEITRVAGADMKPVASRQRGGRVRAVHIAKFLQVNRAVDGLGGADRLSLPNRGFAAKFSLWKGNPVGTPFLMGC